MAASASQPALVDAFFAAELSGSAVSLDSAIGQNYPGWFARLADRSGFARGLALFRLGRSHPIVGAVCDARGFWTFLFLEAWLGKRPPRVVVFELIRRQPSGWRRVLYPFWFRLIARPAMRRTLRAGQVMTAWEKDRYAGVFGVPAGRLEHISWPLIHRGDELPPFDEDPGHEMVLSSGRPACDWETLFEAAAGREWPLTVVCGKKDLRRLEELNRGGRARLLHDIPFKEHDALLKRASVYVVSLKETGGSAGQVRLSNAVRAGAPVVATAVRGLEGYITDGETGLTVRPGDGREMRSAIESLLADAARRKMLRTAAFERARGWTFEQYIDRMREMIGAGPKAG
ncbi:MAG: glycosyltransferase [Actinobacteria bacterium]|nr:glycosyltransferase [Actinomycetota bacterium]